MCFFVPFQFRQGYSLILRVLFMGILNAFHYTQNQIPDLQRRHFVYLDVHSIHSFFFKQV